MDFKEKRQERKQKREAKAYFNANNEYKMNWKKWILIVLIGLLVACIGTISIETLAGSMGFRLGFLYIVLGWFVASAIIYITKAGNVNIGVVSAVTFLVGLFVGMIIYNVLSLYQLGVSPSVAFSPSSLQQIINFILRGITESPISTIMYCMGAGMAYGVGSR